MLLGVAGSVYTEQTLRPLGAMGIKGHHQKRTIQNLQRHAIQALHATWKQRQTIIRTGRSNHDNQAPVEGRGGVGRGGGRAGGTGMGGRREGERGRRALMMRRGRAGEATPS